MAEEWWRTLPRGAVIWLSGDLGAGKTTLAQALAKAAGASRRATSPSFALVHEYPSPEGAIIHVDCYRLRHPDEAPDLDLPELKRRARLLIIEWPEKAGSHAPAPNIHLQLAHGASPDHRKVERVA